MMNQITAILSTALPAIGVALGQAKATNYSLNSINIQPSSKNEISRTLLIGLALIETSAIIGLVISLSILKINLSTGTAIALIILSFLGFFVGITSYKPVAASAFAVANQPFLHKNISNTMLLGLSFLQTPIIFSFVLALIFRIQNPTSVAQQLKLIASSLALFIGSSGAIISMAEFNAKVCSMIGFNRNAFQKIFKYALISQAMIETPILLCLIVSLIIVSTSAKNITEGTMILAAGICMGISCITAGLESGRIASQGVENIAKNPELSAKISKTTIIGQGLLDTFAIYGLIISLLILIMK